MIHGGTTLSKDDLGKGVSLMLCQTEKGKELLEMANLKTQEVDLDEAVAHNTQLRHPSKRPANRSSFFSEIENGKSFNRSVFKNLVGPCVRQIVKRICITLGLIRITPPHFYYVISYKQKLNIHDNS